MSNFNDVAREIRKKLQQLNIRAKCEVMDIEIDADRINAINEIEKIVSECNDSVKLTMNVLDTQLKGAFGRQVLQVLAFEAQSKYRLIDETFTDFNEGVRTKVIDGVDSFYVHLGKVMKIVEVLRGFSKLVMI
ncbi:hypothetical protein [uncultured Abiotrophia sp.]|uniref:hypothetical protein n=1 Tax=uncultured Abiotrophia sp. TaxID=316094 RepID=UPI0028897C18|nr:hypothetical protein [uncultured Abiotrophia sp.]